MHPVISLICRRLWAEHGVVKALLIKSLSFDSARSSGPPPHFHGAHPGQAGLDERDGPRVVGGHLVRLPGARPLAGQRLASVLLRARSFPQSQNTESSHRA